MYNIEKDDFIILNKCIYGHVQGEREYYQKTVNILKKFGFVSGNLDPFLYVKKSEKGIVSVTLHVDDNLIIGYIEAINEAITTLY